MATAKSKYRTVLVTGASSGIGLACASRFLAEGMQVAALDLAAPPTHSEILWDRPVDVRNSQAVDDYVAHIADRLGSIDVLVNAAGISGGAAPTAEIDEAEFDRIVSINLKGAVLVSRAVLRLMLKYQLGNIVHIASVAGVEASPGKLPYSASKAGLIQATRTMAWEYGRQGIRVNCVCPGLVDTPMTNSTFSDSNRLEQMLNWAALGRAGKAYEIASAVQFLASDEASFITGTTLMVDGGWTAGRKISP